MAEPTPTMQLWVARLSFLGLATVLVFLRLLPLDTMPRLWAAPDILLVAALAWTVRRPAAVPVLLLAAVFLVADMLFQRPPGLMTAIVLIASEMIRSRWQFFRNATFPMEWLGVALALAGIMLGYRAVIAVTMLPQDPLLLTLSGLVLSILSYPLVVGLAQVLFGLRRRAPGEVDTLGHRL
jgi:rod shape-determining protein MreD